MAAVFRPNPAGLRDMLASPMVENAIGRVCHQGKAAAERNTPVDTGRMKASWRVWTGRRNGVAAGRIYNTAVSPDSRRFPYPIVVERGAHNQPRQRPLGRAIDEMTVGK